MLSKAPPVKEPYAIQKLIGKRSLTIPPWTAEILPLQKKLLPLLKRVWPDASDKEISWFVADLTGLWEVSRWHIALVQKLLRIDNKVDKSNLQEWSEDLDINWFSNAPGHLKTMRKELDQFKASLYGYIRKRKKSPKGHHGPKR